MSVLRPANTSQTQDTGSTAAEKHALRYLELGQGGKSHRFVQYFVGHTGRVTALALNPKNDTLLSAAQVYVWLSPAPSVPVLFVQRHPSIPGPTSPFRRVHLHNAPC